MTLLDHILVGAMFALAALGLVAGIGGIADELRALARARASKTDSTTNPKDDSA